MLRLCVRRFVHVCLRVCCVSSLSLCVCPLCVCVCPLSPQRAAVVSSLGGGRWQQHQSVLVQDQRVAAEEDDSVGIKIPSNQKSRASSSSTHAGHVTDGDRRQPLVLSCSELASRCWWSSSCAADVPDGQRLLLVSTLREAGPAQAGVGGRHQDGRVGQKRTRQPANLSIQDWEQLVSGLGPDPADWFWRVGSGLSANHLTEGL